MSMTAERFHEVRHHGQLTTAPVARIVKRPHWKSIDVYTTTVFIFIDLT